MTSTGYVKLKSGVECNSNDEYLNQFSNVGKCAEACKNKPGCNFFLYGTGWWTKGFCYWEKTSSASCPEGWGDYDYDFFQLTFGNTKYYIVKC